MVSASKLEEADVEYCGIDLASRASAVCIMNEQGQIVLEEMMATEERDFGRIFDGRHGVRCVIESSPLAEWLCRLLEGMGQKPVIIDARRAKAVIATKKKTDKIDARKLAQMARTEWYTEVHRKSVEARRVRSWLQARMGMVQVMRSQGSRIRGLLRAHGIRLTGVPRKRLAERVRQVVAEKAPELAGMLEPLLESWEHALRSAKEMERQIAERAKGDPVCEHLMEVPSVGPLVVSAYVATIDDPRRFSEGKQVAAYLGLVPGVFQSGDTDYRGRITKEGDHLTRWLLIEAATVLLSQVGSRDPLKEWGLKLAEKKGIAKARVAVARKLAILLHRLWVSGEVYNPLRPRQDRQRKEQQIQAGSACTASSVHA